MENNIDSYSLDNWGDLLQCKRDRNEIDDAYRHRLCAELKAQWPLAAVIKYHTVYSDKLKTEIEKLIDFAILELHCFANTEIEQDTFRLSEQIRKFIDIKVRQQMHEVLERACAFVQNPAS